MSNFGPISMSSYPSPRRFPGSLSHYFISDNSSYTKLVHSCCTCHLCQDAAPSTLWTHVKTEFDRWRRNNVRSQGEKTWLGVSTKQAFCKYTLGRNIKSDIISKSLKSHGSKKKKLIEWDMTTHCSITPWRIEEIPHMDIAMASSLPQSITCMLAHTYCHLHTVLFTLNVQTPHHTASYDVMCN